MALVRASSLDLFLACSGYLHLPAAPTVYTKAEEAAAWGTMVHTWKQTGKIVHENKRTAASFKKRAARVNREKLWPTEHGWHEVGLAYNWNYGYAVSHFGRNNAEVEEWKRSFGDNWITGTCDYFNEETLEVNDLKTGKWWSKTPRESAQIAFYAMCLDMLFGDGRDIPLSCTHWPRYPAKGLPDTTEESVTRDELARFEEKLQRACEESLRPAYNPGEDQCRFCPARNNCLFAYEYEEKSY